MLQGALAAMVTPLTEGGRDLDEAALAPLVAFLHAGGLDGVLALGTTGEGILLTVAERRRAAERLVALARPLATPRGRFAVAVHCGAQTTADTVALAEHAAAVGAAAVVVVGPPYFAFDDEALLRHFAAAARACAPTPFYAYEFAARAGYSLSTDLLKRLRDAAPNLRGLKVSNNAWERVAPYLLPGLDAFVGYEGLIARGLAAGATGAVSGLAAAFPEAVTAVARAPSGEGAARLAAMRAALQAFPFHAALKETLALRGLPVRGDVRAPLRGLRADERARLRRVVAPYVPGGVPPAR
jgi:dihydrodipicolinate synthase/N-acetylneuraminate lyase